LIKLKKFFILQYFIERNNRFLNTKVKSILDKNAEALIKIILHNMYYYDYTRNADSINITNNTDGFNRILLDLYKFKLKFLNIVTLIAFYGEDFLENIKTCIVKKPSLYYDMLSAYSMNDKGENDILGLFKLGEKFAKKAKIKIHWPVKHGKEGLNKYSIKLNNDLKKMFK
jgi:hypothetical protein